MKTRLFFILSWTTSSLLWSTAQECTDITDKQCSCRKKGNVFRICSNESTAVHQAMSCKYRRLEVFCCKGEPLDTYLPIIPQASELRIHRCNVTERWTRNLTALGIKSVFLEEVNELHSVIDDFSLKSLPKLNHLQMSGYTKENFAKLSIKFPNLTTLQLKNNNLETLPPHLFKELTNLQILDLQSNNLSDIPKDLFLGLPFLEILDISKNTLRSLPNLIFQDLGNLQILHLEENKLENLPKGLFMNTSYLKKLYLQGNHLINLKDVLGNVGNLEILNISDNPLQELPISNNRLEVKQVYLNDLNFSMIPDMFFVKATEVRILSMERNRLKGIEGNWFNRLSKLAELYLRGNDIRHLKRSMLQSSRTLKILDLSQNKLEHLSKAGFTDLTFLKRLNISGNLLKNIEKMAFSNLTELEVLDMSNNKLTEMRSSYHHSNGTWKLEHLNASGNSITKIPELQNWQLKSLDFSNNNIMELPLMRDYKNLEILRLEKNKISHLLATNAFLPNDIDSYIYLQDNIITTINVTFAKFTDEDYNYDDIVTKTLPKKLLFHLEGNPLVCDCHLYYFYEHISNRRFCFHHAIFSDANHLQCNKPSEVKGRNVKELTEERFACEMTAGCADECRCSFRTKNSDVVMDCSGHEMKKMPESAPENITILHIENNNFTSLEGLRHKRWQSLKEIHADGNCLSCDNSSDWFFPPKLQVLSLRRNGLSALPKPLKEYIAKNNSFQIYLANNSWLCDCRTAMLKVYLSNHHLQVKDFGQILCKYPEGNRNSSMGQLMALKEELMCPTSTSHHKHWLIAVVLSSFVLVISVIAFAIVCFKYRQTILGYMYVHFNWLFFSCFKREDPYGKEFDAFISCSSHDMDTVLKLIEELEDKEPYYKLCVHERNVMPGAFITDCITQSVEKSKKTIIILSDRFLKSEWFDIQFKVAYYQMVEDKIDRLVLIIKGDLPPQNSLHKDLQYVLSTKTYLTWGEKWFWEKIRYALPHDVKRRNALEMVVHNSGADRTRLIMPFESE